MPILKRSYGTEGEKKPGPTMMILVGLLIVLALTVLFLFEGRNMQPASEGAGHPIDHGTAATR